MKEEIKKLTLELIEKIESRKKGKIDPPNALFNEIWHEVFILLKDSISELKKEGKIVEIDTINISSYRVKKS